MGPSILLPSVPISLPSLLHTNFLPEHTCIFILPDLSQNIPCAGYLGHPFRISLCAPARFSFSFPFL
jgi:hypothetical protein